MYCNYYGFREKPFNITPNPRFIYLSKNHKEAFAHLLYGINNHAGFIAITGEVGTGKTTVLRTILEQLDDASHLSAIILNPCLTALELLRNINREFGIAHQGLENGALLEELNRFLLHENRAGRTIILVIDEAQNLAPDVLEQIRLISNLETEADKLIQIILAGQPELNTLLARPDLRQLSQRITVRYHLLPMDFEDSSNYIKHRLQVAGGGEWISFAPGAIKRIFGFAKGSPRLINMACDRALLIGYTENSGDINTRITTNAIKELQGGEQQWTVPPKIVIFAVITLLFAALLLPRLPGTLAAYKKSRKDAPPKVAATPIKKQDNAQAQSVTESAAVEKQPALNPASSKPVAVQPQSTAAPVISAANVQVLPWQNLPKGASAAVSAVARLWRLAPAAEAAGNKDSANVATLAREAGLSTIPLNGKIGKLLGFDLPVIAELKLPDKNGVRYIALTGVDRNRISIAPALGGRSEFLRKELDGALSGRGFLLWKNHQDIPLALSANTVGIEVIRLQILLIGTGFFKGEPSGVFDEATVAALNQFSKKHRLKEAAKLDQIKLLLLYRDSSGFYTPRLGIKATL